MDGLDAAALQQFRQVFLALDYVGVFLFAITGALVAARARLDIITGVFFAGMTGMGGGTIRDLLIGAPVFWVGHPWFVAVCLSAAGIVWVLRTDYLPAKVLRWLDALGLSGYCAFGALKALSFGIDPVPAAVMGIITAVFGGVLRDVVADRPSALLQHEIYITAAVAGAALTVVLVACDIGPWWAGIAGAILAFMVRAGAIARGWALPGHRG